MGRPRKDLSYIERIPIIADFLKENVIIDDKRVRRYLLEVATIYPFLEERCGGFEQFLNLDRNHKARVFIDFVNRELERRLKKNPEKDRDLVKNRLLQVVWRVQGFMGLISSDKDLRANSRWIESFTPLPSFVAKITVLDVYDLYEILPDRGRRRLKLQLFTGWNNVDLIDLRLNDFKSTHDNNFLYVAKTRVKTIRKRVAYLNVFDSNFHFELERYCNRYDIGPNERIFPVTSPAISKLYKYYLKRNESALNPKVMPKWIRQLCFTELRPVFKNDPDLYALWTQHKLGVLRSNYIKDYIPRFMELYDDIKGRVCLGNLKRQTIELKELKDDIRLELRLQSDKLDKLEKKLKKEEDLMLENLADKIARKIRNAL